MYNLFPNLSPYLTKKLIAVYVVGYVSAVYFSVGFHHLDEHYQILEFAMPKLDLVGNLPWEYGAQIRSALQPTIVFLLYSTLRWVSEWTGSQTTNPFLVVELLRFFSLLLHTGSLMIFIEVFIKEVKPQYRRTLVWLSIMIWFFPYVAVRFSSENISRILFLLSLSIPFWWEQIKVQTNQVSKLISKVNISWVWTFSGLLAGFAFYARFQVAVLSVAFVLWLLIIKKTRLGNILMFSIGVIVSVGINVLIDRWFYGNWVITPWNYFYKNLIEGVASSFGVSPWYDYIVQAGQYNFLFFPLYAIVPLLFIGVFPKHIFSWLIAMFSLVHFGIGHKELRFLYPLITFLPWVWMLSWQKLVDTSSWLGSHENGLLVNILKKYFWIFHVLFWLIMAIRPADLPTKFFYEYIYNNYPNSTVWLYRDDDKSGELPNSIKNFNPIRNFNFYVHPGTELNLEINSKKEFTRVVESYILKPQQKSLLIVSPHILDKEFISNQPIALEYVYSFPFKSVSKYPQFYNIWVEQAKLRIFHIYVGKVANIRH